MSSMGSNRIVPLQVLRTLERYASEERPMSNLQIIARIQEDERVTLARNTVAAAVAASVSEPGTEPMAGGSGASPPMMAPMVAAQMAFQVPSS